MMQGVQFEEVWKALFQSYTPRGLGQMLRSRLGIVLENIVRDGSTKDMAFDLLRAAEMEGWEVDLIREAYRFNADSDPRNLGNPALLRVYEKYGLAPRLNLQKAGIAVPKSATIADGLEAAVRSRLSTLDFAVFRERMARVEVQVCKVEIDGQAKGTGFLVGPQAVLTNYHVLKNVLQGPIPSSKVACRFDYKILADKSCAPGVLVGLHATEWNLDFSRCSDAETTLHPDEPPPDPDELDYALIKLVRAFGDEPASPKGGSDAPRRGWLPLVAEPIEFQRQDALMIAQHPGDQPLKLTVDTDSVLGMNAGKTRVRYATNTDHGASGSPVFDLDWKLVALHHLGDPAYDHPATYNQGVPIHLIRQRISAQGKDSALGGDVS
jgi:hypothetical protein